MDAIFGLFVYFFIIYYLRFVAVGKVLLNEYKISSNEFIYIGLTGLTLITFRVFAIIIRDMLDLAPTDVVFTVYLFAMPVFFIYLFVVKSTPTKHSLLFTFTATMLLTAFPDIFLSLYGVLKAPIYGELLFSSPGLWRSILITFVVSVLLAYLLEKASHKFWPFLNKHEFLQNICLAVSFVFTIFIGSLRLYTNQISLSESIDFMTFVNLLMILPFILAIVVYSKTSKESQRIKAERVERENIQNHLKELEHQFTSIRKFKHDYQNILASMETFFLEKKLSELETYFFEKVMPTFEAVSSNNFVFEALSKIKISEVKSLISAKIVVAQNISQDVKVSFEAPDEIEEVFIDSITLVRILGILLDNAIEELEILSEGNLAIACFNDKDSVVFIIQNTYNSNLPTIQMIKSSGFTTKENHSGLGLHILEELQEVYPNISLSTIIDEYTFTQKLTISNANNFND